MIATFAFDKNTSPVNMFDAKVVRHEPAQFMSLCQFNNAYWEFDKKRNYAPCIVFDGSIERLDAIDTKFPGNIDTVYFTENKPSVQFRYNLDEDQLAELAKKGFWSEDGVNMPSLFTTAKFQLETYAVVEEITNTREDPSVPILNVELIKPYENEFDAMAYELVSKITKRKPEESKAIENTVQIDVQQSIADEIAAANELLADYNKAALTAANNTIPTKEELDDRVKLANINASVSAERDELKKHREAGNARVEAERERIAREQEEMAKSGFKIDESNVKSTVDAAPVETLAGRVETDMYENNHDIFVSSEKTDAEMPDKAAEFMKRLGGANIENVVKSDEKKDDKRGDSGSASGVQGLGVYTFEDQDAAQFEVRADEGKGNEKPEEEKDNDDEPKEEPKSEVSDVNARTAKLAASIDDTNVNFDVKHDDKSDRSK